MLQKNILAVFGEAFTVPRTVIDHSRESGKTFETPVVLRYPAETLIGGRDSMMVGLPNGDFRIRPVVELDGAEVENLVTI